MDRVRKNGAAEEAPMKRIVFMTALIALNIFLLAGTARAGWWPFDGGEKIVVDPRLSTMIQRFSCSSTKKSTITSAITSEGTVVYLAPCEAIKDTHTGCTYRFAGGQKSETLEKACFDVTGKDGVKTLENALCVGPLDINVGPSCDLGCQTTLEVLKTVMVGTGPSTKSEGDLGTEGSGVKLSGGHALVSIPLKAEYPTAGCPEPP